MTAPVRAHAVRIGPRTAAAIIATSVIGAIAFAWPLVADAQSTAVAHADDAPLLFAVIVPLLLAVVLAQLADGGMDAKGVAVLGVAKATRGGLQTWAVRIERSNGEVLTGYVDRASGVVMDWVVNSGPTPAAQTTPSASDDDRDDEEGDRVGEAG